MRTKAKKNRKANRQTGGIEPAKFVEVWQTSTSPDQVAKLTGLSKETAIRKAISFRKNKVPLKRMSRGRSKADWTKIIELAARFNKTAA